MGDAAQVISKTTAISSVAELGEPAMALARPEMAPREYVALLLEKKLFADAVRFVAHALPKREGVWWGWMCARRSAGEKPPVAAKAALDATERWIAQPNDANRRAAMDAAEKAGFELPAGCAGLAAFFSGDSLAPAGLPPIPPGPYLTAKAVAGAVIMAAVTEPEKAPEKFESYIAQGLDVVNRLKLWEEERK